MSSGALETQVDLSRARLEMMLKVLDVATLSLPAR